MKLVQIFENVPTGDKTRYTGRHSFSVLDPKTNDRKKVTLKCFYDKILYNSEGKLLSSPILDFEYCTLEHDLKLGDKVWLKGARFDYENFDEFKPYMDTKEYTKVFFDSVGEGNLVES